MKIAVIGGGASGLMAAIAAAKNGAQVTIYEKMNKVGKKILASPKMSAKTSSRFILIL